MITSVHTLIYTDDVEAASAFLRDVLGLPYVDAGGQRLFFRTGPSELGLHPTSGEGWSTPAHHELSLMCDDIEATVTELSAKGARFSGPVEDRGWGLTATIEVPGAGGLLLYEPRHATAHDL